MRKSKAGSSYPDNWKEIAKKCKDDAGGCCVRCGIPNQKGHVLTVHHLDMNPANCEWWNLVALCQQCHLKIQAKVVIERVWMFDHSEWFKPYVAGYTAHRLGWATDKQQVMDNLETLLRNAQAEGVQDDLS